MKGIILAAGRGSRMGKLTDSSPKCLSLVKDRPLIEHQIDALLTGGVQEIAVVTGYKAEMLHSYKVRFFFNANWEYTNMVASLECAQEWLENFDCLVSYSDIFYKPKIVQDLVICQDDIVIAYDPQWKKLWYKRFETPSEDAESFRISPESYLLEIGQKNPTLELVEGQYMGLLKFSKGTFKKHLLDLTEEEGSRIDMTHFLAKLLKKNIKIKALPNYEFWAECDTEKDLRVANESYI